MKKYAIVYDVKLRQPGCVLLQAVLGGTVPSELFHTLFPSETWLLGRTPNLKVYQTTLEELLVVAGKTRSR